MSYKATKTEKTVKPTLLYTVDFTTLFLIIFIDYDHLKCFVKVSKSIAENDDDINNLSHLCEISQKFSALIYNLPESAGFGELYSRCKSVLDKLQQSSNLINHMVNYVLCLLATEYM